MGVRYFKSILTGGFAGAVFGYMYFVLKPLQGFPSEKLFAHTGERNWSGRMFRFGIQVVRPYVMVGAGALLSYNVIRDYLRHHEETNNDRPLIIDHVIALTTLAVLGGFFYGNSPRAVAVATVMSIFFFSPMSWWFMKHAKVNNQVRSVNVFYEDSATPQDIERIQQ
jgi:hypothetical protein